MIGGVVAQRFEVVSVAGKGGMGTVFRARDRTTGAHVALKVVEGVYANDRFVREASLLANLEHEAIVRYVMHGALDHDRMFLAMDWLDGSSLDEHLARGPLPIADVLAIGRRLAGALAEAHARGIVHRDVKPSNVMLPDGRADRATLVDFGVARAGAASKAITATGAVIGTPAYMAPEQVRGERTVDARADVFSVGCVLFECLSGRPPFAGEHVIAVLAKILLEPAPRLASLRPDVPAALDAFLARLLEKSPDLRPKDGRAIEIALQALDTGSTVESVAPRIGDTERRLATVLLARPKKEKELGFAATEDVLGVTEESLVVRAGSVAKMSLAALADGTIVGAVLSGDSGAEAALRAVRCATFLQREIGAHASIAVATGRAVVAGDLPVGEAIDAAARLLQHGAPGLFMDDATTALVDGRTEVVRTCTVMGKEVPCFGRDRELATLEALFSECIDEPIARVALVVAPPGIGKSRLQRELVGRLRRRADPPAVWLGLVDPLMQGAAHALAGDLFRRVLDLPEGTPAAERRSRLCARLAKAPDADRIARFLGEIVDAPLDEDELVRAARRNPSVMAAQIQTAAADFVVHELARGPVVLVLEDVHWADAASLRLVSSVMKRAKDLPLFVVALARPSIDEIHPKLWEEHRCQRLVLDPLLRKAAEKLARAVLGDDADVDAVVRRAQGNPLFVEELARARAKGESSELPPTIAAAAEARLTSLPAEARQALRAASIFGERFWRGAVAHLVGPRVAAVLDTHLEAIAEAELASPTEQPSRFAGEREYVFRHALVRDAAYAMLTDDDRAIGHALAAEWLESRVDDAALLAQHFESGERKERAAVFYVRAAQQALAADELATVLAHAARAEALGASGELLGRVRLMQADAEVGRMNNVEAVAKARAALALLPRGSEGWFYAIGIGCAASGKLGELDTLFGLIDLLESERATDDVTGRARAIARVRAAIQAAWSGELERAHALFDTCGEEPGTADDLALEAWRLDATFELAFASGETLHPSECRRAQELYMRIGDKRGAITQTGNEVITLLSLGCFDEACALVDASLAEVEGSIPLTLVYARATSYAWKSASIDHDYDRLTELASSILSLAAPRALAANTVWLAMMLLPAGRHDQAKKLVEDVLHIAEKSPAFHAVALAILARIREKEGDLEGAFDLVLRAVEISKRGMAVWGATFIDLAHIDLLAAHGRKEDAQRALDGSLERVQRRVERIGEYGQRYLAHGGHVAELLARRQSV